ncbi:unnamed protein product [Nippostrongylus brasiliensis]|uniref:Major facilitator superfamily transporter n=1 Tax=Nippostrongylus brasiliensis TaxID=27835 RepID=A0A0N4YUJ0_NIPBR|nr:unnamed protein product [Nippostrongylus brasiliensis]
MSTNEQQPSASTPGGSGKSKKKKRDEDYVPSPPSDRVSVSREAGLWSFSQLWDMFYMQAIAPMIATEKAEEKANEVANS